jgi:hypothetical protein
MPTGAPPQVVVVRKNKFFGFDMTGLDSQAGLAYPRGPARSRLLSRLPHLHQNWAHPAVHNLAGHPSRFAQAVKHILAEIIAAAGDDDAPSIGMLTASARGSWAEAHKVRVRPLQCEPPAFGPMGKVTVCGACVSEEARVAYPCTH